MSITIRENRHGVSIRATGVDGQRVLRAVCAALEPQANEAFDNLPIKRNGKAAGAIDDSQTSVRVTLKPDTAAPARR